MIKNLPLTWETGFGPWVRKILWRREWQPILVFLFGESHGQRRLKQATVHGDAKSQTQLSDNTCTVKPPWYCCSVTKWCPTLFNPDRHQAALSSTIFQSLLQFTSTELVMLSNHLILCHPLLLLPSIFPSIWVSSNKLALCIRWPKYWKVFSFSQHQSFQWIFRTDFL